MLVNNMVYVTKWEGTYFSHQCYYN